MRAIAAVWVLVCAALPVAYAAPYVFSDGTESVDTVTHVDGYTGVGAHIVVTIGIRGDSPNALDMVMPMRNVVRTWNGLIPSTGNLKLGADSDLASTQFDFESVLLHEIGHALGLAHSNLASESGVATSRQDGTKSRTGANGVFNVDSGTDGIYGSGDDSRFDDVNLYWFRIGDDNPIAPLPSAIDKTTYSLSLGNLPAGHTYAANSARAVLSALGVPKTEGVMQQGTLTDEAQRTLTNEEIAAVRFAMSGVDELQGTADDYTFELLYVGFTTAADVVVDMDSTQTAFAQTAVSPAAIVGSSTHVSIDHPANVSYIPIFFSENVNWYFNQISNAVDPDNVYVDFTLNDNGNGSQFLPYDNLTDALGIVNPAGIVHISGGDSSETFAGAGKINQSVVLQNDGGVPVRIGTP